MPTLCMFYGIVILMNYNDHQPPHFHARYQGYKASFDFDGNLTAGEMPEKQAALIVAWAKLHKDELEANWSLRESGEPIFRIPPLQ